jgi:hypothetical protein
LVRLDCDLDAADRFAKIATAIMRGIIACGHDASTRQVEPFGKGSNELNIMCAMAHITFLLNRLCTKSI